MKIFIDTGHPGHIHLFKNFANIMENNGHKVLITTRQKEVEVQLLQAYKLDYKLLGPHYKKKLLKGFSLIKYSLLVYLEARKFKPDVFLSHGSIYAAWVSKFLKKPHISFEDTGNNEQVRLYLPFTDVVLTSSVFPKEYGVKQIRYLGHHETAYLYPHYFNPNDSIYKYLKIDKNTKYAIIRFIAWNASHDIGQSGMNNKLKKEVIEMLEMNGYRIFISSEAKLPEKYSKFQISIPPEMMHDALYFADIFVGEGATMAMEAGVLGTASFYVNSLVRSYCQDLESFGLCSNFSNSEGVLEKLEKVIQTEDMKGVYRKRASIFLSQKIDVTAFTVWFIENYPESVSIMRENPNYQLRFK